MAKQPRVVIYKRNLLKDKTAWKALLHYANGYIGWLCLCGSLLAFLCLHFLTGCESTTEATRIWRIVRDPLWYPFELINKEQGMVGFTNDLMKAVGKETNTRIDLISLSTQNILAELDTGNFDGILWGFPPNYYETNRYDYSQPFYLVGPVLIVSSHALVHSLEELKGNSVGIMDDINLTFNIPNYSTINLKIYHQIIMALDALQSNQIDALIAHALPAYSHISALFCHRLKVVTPPLTNDGLRLILKKSNQSQQFIAQFNSSLQKLKENGEYQELLDKWGLVNTELPARAQKDLNCHP
jgi:polar amino acid transport system substrate-binding protein